MDVFFGDLTFELCHSQDPGRNSCSVGPFCTSRVCFSYFEAPSIGLRVVFVLLRRRARGFLFLVLLRISHSTFDCVFHVSQLFRSTRVPGSFSYAQESVGLDTICCVSRPAPWIVPSQDACLFQSHQTATRTNVDASILVHRGCVSPRETTRHESKPTRKCHHHAGSFFSIGGMEGRPGQCGPLHMPHVETDGTTDLPRHVDVVATKGEVRGRTVRGRNQTFRLLRNYGPNSRGVVRNRSSEDACESRQPIATLCKKMLQLEVDGNLALSSRIQGKEKSNASSTNRSPWTKWIESK